MMHVTYQELMRTTLCFYGIRAQKESVAIMPPTFGVVVHAQGRYWAFTVAHTMAPEDETLEITSGAHPAIAAQYKMGTDAVLLAKIDPQSRSEWLVDKDHDLMAIPLADYEGPAWHAPGDIAAGNDHLLQPALIFVPDFAPNPKGELTMVGSGLAGIISDEDDNQAIISAQGASGMSGAPVVIRGAQGYTLLGLYTGTPTTTPLTNKALHELAKVTKCRLFG